MGYIVIIAIIVLGISLNLAYQFQEVAELKGYDNRKYFWISFLLGLPGWLLIIALPNQKKAVEQDCSVSSVNSNDELPEL